MTMARTAVRLCVVSAITGATLAGARVYDSQIVDFDPDVYAGDGQPVITVLSDHDEGDQLSEQNGGPPFRRNIEIVIEISIIQTVRLDGINPQTGEHYTDPSTGLPYPPGSYSVSFPDTDARAEMSLDFIEFQVIRRLSEGRDRPCELFREFNRITKTDSHRQTADETSRKIASRLLTLHCDTKDDEEMDYSVGLVGFDCLPEPLRSVALTFPSGTEGYRACTALAEAMQATIASYVVPAFAGVDFTIDASPTVDNGGSDEVKLSVDLD